VTTSLFHRRRAERLAQLLDEATGRPRHHARAVHDEELAGYVRLGTGLVRTAGVVAGPSDEFRTSLRAMLVATAERDGERLDLTACQLIRIEDGKIVEMRGHYSDQYALDDFWS